MILNQVNMPQLLNLQVVLRDRLHPTRVHVRLPYTYGISRPNFFGGK
jgi:hypothetical protein